MTLRSVLITAFLAVPLLANAQSATPRIDARQERQATRIEQGSASGTLTSREAEKLQRGQDRIERAENRIAADGTVTPREKIRLEHRQDQQSRQIQRETMDRQTDFDRDGRNDRREHRADRREHRQARRDR